MYILKDWDSKLISQKTYSCSNFHHWCNRHLVLFYFQNEAKRKEKVKKYSCNAIPGQLASLGIGLTIEN